MSIEEFKGKYTEDAFTPDLEDMVNNPPHYNQHQNNLLVVLY